MSGFGRKHYNISSLLQNSHIVSDTRQVFNATDIIFCLPRDKETGLCSRSPTLILGQV